MEYYVEQALSRLDLSSLHAFGFDETASKRGHNYVTVFIDMARKTLPVVFAIPGKGKKTVTEFTTFIEKHGANSEQVLEVVCDMSPSFLSGVKDEFPKANVTVDWFHVVQLFTRAVDEVRKEERKHNDMPKALRWAVLKTAESPMTDKQADLEQYELETAKAWRVKEKLRWIREAPTAQTARWRLTNFIKFTLDEIGSSDALEPVRKALATLEKHSERILQRWTSTYTNARIEGLNSLFQAASPAAEILKST
ncbi:transposase [Vibrio sp. SS-MA-C1-2]|uniref:transposase n=1 Tax=Vibrio sp. SS-MA-C1-2 TaxID=2908646 RepID=UPI001F22FE6D|nr:transposase [Vibrio sp. SS-MA-C1-2]